MQTLPLDYFPQLTKLQQLKQLQQLNLSKSPGTNCFNHQNNTWIRSNQHKKQVFIECSNQVHALWTEADCIPKSFTVIKGKLKKFWTDFGNRRKYKKRHPFE